MESPLSFFRRDGFAMWRMRWFPFRTHEYLGSDGEGGSRLSPPVWQWPEVLGRDLRG
jgi:hypothetical protein